MNLHFQNYLFPVLSAFVYNDNMKWIKDEGTEMFVVTT